LDVTLDAKAVDRGRSENVSSRICREPLRQESGKAQIVPQADEKFVAANTIW
jgi:hypothetical protein